MRIMGLPRLLLAALAGCLLLAGCGSGPSQVRAAVLIGDQEVSVDQVQQLIDNAVADRPAARQLAQQHKLDLLGREIVRQLVLHELLGRAAQREHLTADPSLVAEARNLLTQPVSTNSTDPSELAASIVAHARSADYASDRALEQQLGTKYFD